MKTILDLISTINTEILYQIISEVSIATYRILYITFVSFGTLMSFVKLNDECSTFGFANPKSVFFAGLFMGFGFATISFIFHISRLPISTFFIAMGANYYFMSGDSRIMDILKKDYL